jgi:hypothetical protein
MGQETEREVAGTRLLVAASTNREDKVGEGD